MRRQEDVTDVELSSQRVCCFLPQGHPARESERGAFALAAQLLLRQQPLLIPGVLPNCAPVHHVVPAATPPHSPAHRPALQPLLGAVAGGGPRLAYAAHKPLNSPECKVLTVCATRSRRPSLRLRRWDDADIWKRGRIQEKCQKKKIILKWQDDGMWHSLSLHRKLWCPVWWYSLSSPDSSPSSLFHFEFLLFFFFAVQNCKIWLLELVINLLFIYLNLFIFLSKYTENNLTVGRSAVGASKLHLLWFLLKLYI